MQISRGIKPSPTVETASYMLCPHPSPWIMIPLNDVIDDFGGYLKVHTISCTENVEYSY